MYGVQQAAFEVYWIEESSNNLVLQFPVKPKKKPIDCSLTLNWSHGHFTYTNMSICNHNVIMMQEEDILVMCWYGLVYPSHWPYSFLLRWVPFQLVQPLQFWLSLLQFSLGCSWRPALQHTGQERQSQRGGTWLATRQLLLHMTPSAALGLG